MPAVDVRRRPQSPAEPTRPGRKARGGNEKSRPSGRLLGRTGGDLLSQAREGQVPSALWGLTALFGMGRGVSPTPKPPEIVRDRASRTLKTTQPTNTGIKNIRQALDPLVPVSYAHYCASRSGLSTWWSTRGLTPSRGWENSSRGRLPA